jgi:CRP-like cAMP-binding protein
MALSHLTRVEVRLLALFWHLADRWGRVASDGVLVPLRLTHQTLAALVGAQRPSVTTALGGLADSGRVTRRDDGGWVLHGEPPLELGAPGAEVPVSASADPRARLRGDGPQVG